VQQTPQVGWDPIAIDYRPPLALKLLLLYLLVVVVLSLVKSASVLRMLWSLTRDSRQRPRMGYKFLHVWKTCSNKIQSMKRLVFITLLWTVLVASLLLRSVLIRIVEQKAFWPAAVGGSLAEVTTAFTLGILVCAVLYTACAFYEGALLRSREKWTHARANSDDSPPMV
jgi:hypothetical protein